MNKAPNALFVRPSEDLDLQRLYMEEAARYNLLTPEEEREMGRKIQEAVASGNDEDFLYWRNTLVERNLRFAVHIANRWAQNSSMPTEDLVQIANKGLIRAAESFDPEKMVRFVHYANFWIRQGLLKERDSYGSTQIKPSQTQAGRNRRVQGLVEQFRSEGRVFSNEEALIEAIRTETGFTAKTTREALLPPIREVHLDAPVDVAGEGGGVTYAQYVGDQEDRVEAEREGDIRDATWRVMDAVLDQRERTILALYHGFGDSKELSLTMIGRELGISRERIRQLRDRAYQKIRDAEQARLLREVFDPEDACGKPVRERALAIEGEEDDDVDIES